MAQIDDIALKLAQQLLKDGLDTYTKDYTITGSSDRILLTVYRVDNIGVEKAVGKPARAGNSNLCPHCGRLLQK